MSRLLRFVPLLLVLVLLSGCSRPRRLVLYTDPYWKEVLEAGEGFWNEVSETARSHGFRPVLRQESLDSRDPVPGDFPLRGGDVALVSPFFAARAADAARQHGDVLFVILGGPAHVLPSALPFNVCVLTFDRESACEQAGREAAAMTAGTERGCGVFYLEASEETARQVEAFRRGFFSGGSKEMFVQRKVQDRRDRVQVKKNLEEMARQGVELYMLLTYDLTTYCLDVLRSLNGRAIVQDRVSPRAFEETVVISMEERYLEAVTGILEEAAAAGAEAERMGSEPGRICPGNRYAGKVGLVWNEER